MQIILESCPGLGKIWGKLPKGPSRKQIQEGPPPTDSGKDFLGEKHYFTSIKIE